MTLRGHHLRSNTRRWCCGRAYTLVFESSEAESCPKFAVVVPNQIPRRLAVGRGLTQWLRCPRIGGSSRDAEMHHASGAALNDEEDEQRTEEQVINLEEVTGPNLSSMVVQECAPGLSGWFGCCWRWRTSLAHVLLNGALGYADRQLEELTANALGSPEAVILDQLLDQLDGRRWQLGLGATGRGARLHLPEEAEAGAMPTQQGGGLYNPQGTRPGAEHTGQ